MLSRKPASQKGEKDWFEFSSALAFALVSDYIALRILYFLEPLTTAFPILCKAIEIAEKSLKLFITVSSKSTNALTSARSEFGHNIEKLRAQAARFDEVFDEAALKAFSHELNDRDGKLYQHVRYGSQETTEGLSADLAQIMLAVDRLLLQAIMKLDPADRKLLFFVSPLKNVLLGSRFDHTQNKELVLTALRFRNTEIAEFEVACHQMEREQAALLDEFKVAGQPREQAKLGIQTDR